MYSANTSTLVNPAEVPQDSSNDKSSVLYPLPAAADSPAKRTERNSTYRLTIARFKNMKTENASSQNDGKKPIATAPASTLTVYRPASARTSTIAMRFSTVEYQSAPAR